MESLKFHDGIMNFDSDSILGVNYFFTPIKRNSRSKRKQDKAINRITNKTRNESKNW